MVQENKLVFYFTLGVVQLGRLLFDRIGNRTLFFQHLVYYSTSLGDIWVVTLYFGSTVGHSIYRLVHNNSSMRFLHYFVNLVSLCSNQKWNHAFRDENDDRKGLPLYSFEGLVYLGQHCFCTLVFLLHLDVVYLYQKTVTWMLRPFRSGIVRSVLKLMC